MPLNASYLFEELSCLVCRFSNMHLGFLPGLVPDFLVLATGSSPVWWLPALKFQFLCERGGEGPGRLSASALSSLFIRPPPPPCDHPAPCCPSSAASLCPRLRGREALAFFSHFQYCCLLLSFFFLALLFLTVARFFTLFLQH